MPMLPTQRVQAWWHAHNGTCMVAHAWWHMHGGTYMVAHAWWHMHGGTCMVAHAWWHMHGGTYMVAHAWWHMHGGTCMVAHAWWHMHGGTCMVAHAWWHMHGGTYMVAHAWWHMHGGTCMVAHAWWHMHGGTCMVAHAWWHMHGGTCMVAHAWWHMHGGTCMVAHAWWHMHGGTCMVAHAWYFSGSGISAAVVKQLREETGAGMMACKKSLSDANGDLDTAREILRKKGLATRGLVLSAAGGISAAVVKQLREETGAGMMACKKALTDANGDLDTAREILRKKGLASADKKASRIASEGLVSSYVHSDRIGVLIEVNCETDFVARGSAFQELVEDLGMQVAACPQVEVVSVEDVPAEQVAKEREVELGKEDLASKPEAVRGKIVDGRMAKRLNELALLEQPYIKNDKVMVKDVVKQAIASLGENIRIRRFVRFNLGEGIEKKSADFAAEVAAASQVQAPAAPAAPAPAAPAAEAAPEPAADKPKVAVSMAAVKQLRDATGAGMMDCKKALESTNGDVDAARELLRKKGLASADKKASRIAAEGIVGSYIHDGRIGALIEINCETDFVARGDKFRELVDDLAMQVVACPGVQVVSEEDVDSAWLAKEREIEMGKEDLASKPEAVRGKIVDGRLAKRVSELALLEQPFIKNDKVTVKEVVKEVVAALGENIRVRRFERFTLGEGIEKKVSDFAAEVAAAAGQA
ncbi:unnamed protein product [Closterium sp. NIES-64]|nr:unnamed protein product [Closterium sp. NIES-64]